MTTASASSDDTRAHQHAATVDGFIQGQLPDWLRRASPSQINRLRDRFTLNKASQEQVRAATVDLIPLQAFALRHFTDLLKDRLPPETKIERLQWLEVRREFGRLPGVHWPFYQPSFVRQDGLLRLMQNFTSDDAALEGSGLVQPGSDEVVSGSPVALATDCRRKDVGGLYQTLLEEVFDPANCALLAQDKRSALELVIEIAALKGDISALEQVALHEVAQGSLDQHENLLRGYPGLLSLLGCPVADAMVINLRDQHGKPAGVILHLPSDPHRALRRYDSWQALEAALIADLQAPAYRGYFSGLVALDQRAVFLQALAKRLADDAPDLQVEGLTLQGNVFDDLVSQQVRRLKSDARCLLVPTDEADQQSSASRLQAWESVGLGMFSLAGLFIPAVGAMLFGLLVVQTLSELFEGAVDWYQGHQHEALEHLLGVAESLAVNAALAAGATIAARGFTRSPFVDALQPVKLDGGELRLWWSDLARYGVTPVQRQLMADGLYGNGHARWMRVGEGFFAVRQSVETGRWRLLHPLRAEAYGPAIERVAERGWRLSSERPAEWAEPSRMLQHLWPHEPPLNQSDAETILAMADMDADELRGLLVENRQLPANLRECLRRFTTQRRVSAFFADLASGQVPAQDASIQAWCLAQPGASGLDQNALRALLVSRSSALHPRLVEHLLSDGLSPNPFAVLVQRDFPGLPDAYARQAITGASSRLGSIALAESRVPLSVASQARSLLQLARLSRAIEGLYLPRSYSDEAGELTLSLLERLPGWPDSLHLTLREGSPGGRTIKTIGKQALDGKSFTLVHHEGAFGLYNSAGQALSVGTEGQAVSLADGVIAALPAAERGSLGLARPDAAEQLRARLRTLLPSTRAERARLLGWADAPRWFNPGQRMADGRVGYPLSGRGQSGAGWQALRDRLRALYPSSTDAQLDVRLTQLLQQPGTLYQRVAELEYDFELLQSALDRWLSAALQGSNLTARRLVAERMRQAWRMQGEVIGDASTSTQSRLTLSGVQLQSLPELPLALDFPHISALVISDTSLTHVPSDFLRSFSALRELNLSGNRLLQLPRGIAYLSDLRRLQLARNAIRLDRESVEALASLAHLTHLDLSSNPLGALILRFNQLPQLLEVNLRNCRLGAWPDGLELCPALERADLRDNSIAVVPAAILGMPNVFRRGFLVERNPMSSSELRGLYALDVIQEHLHMPERLSPVDPVTVRSTWLSLVGEAEQDARLYQWDTLEAMPNQQGFFRLLGWLTLTQDHAQARSLLGSRVWSLLDTLQGDVALRDQVYTLAAENLTCLNAVSDCFSDLLRRAAIARAQANSLHERGNDLIVLAQGLFRLDRLDVFSRQDIRQRLEARESVDQLALRLYYRVQLRQRLALPFQPQAMAYPDAAQVTDAQVEEALASVRDAESLEALRDSLSQRDFWRRYLLERHSAAFDLVETAHQVRTAALQARAAGLSAEALARQTEVLQSQRDVEELETIRSLTWQILFGRERGLA